MDKIPDRSFVILELFRKGKGFANQPGNALAKRVVKSLNVAGLASFFARRFITFSWQDQSIGIPKIGMDSMFAGLRYEGV